MIRSYDELTKEQKQEWISSLKVGDEVIVKRDSYGYGATTTYRKGKVHSITKTGRINVMIVEQKHTFTSDGKYWGNRGDTWSSVTYQLRQIDEVYLNHRRLTINRTIFELGLNKLENSYKQLRTVEEIEQYAYVIDKALKELNL